MAFAHVLNKTKAGTEFIQLSRAGNNLEWSAAAVPIQNGSKPVRVDLALKVDNMPFFNQLGKSVRQGPKTFSLTSNGYTTQVTGKFVAATHMYEFVNSSGATVLYSPDTDDEEPESHASVGAVAFVAAVAILAIAAMVIAHDGGSFKGEASKDGEDGSVTVEANGGDGEGEGGGGGSEGGGGGGSESGN